PAVATPTAPRAATLRPVAQQFLATVRANFAQWDLNHDGRLTREEIALDMQNPHFTGDAAAALASLKIGATKSNHLPETRSFSTADIDAIERTLEAGQKLDANFIGYFAAGRKKLEETPRELFAQGTPRLTAIRQMFTSDCYFLSAAGAVAQTNPLALVRLITPNRDGSYTVQFAGQPPVRILRPTDTEIATYTTAKDGIWLNVLQKAYAVLRIRMEPKEPATREALDSGPRARAPAIGCPDPRPARSGSAASRSSPAARMPARQRSRRPAPRQALGCWRRFAPPCRSPSATAAPCWRRRRITPTRSLDTTPRPIRSRCTIPTTTAAWRRSRKAARSRARRTASSPSRRRNS